MKFQGTATLLWKSSSKVDQYDRGVEVQEFYSGEDRKGRMENSPGKRHPKERQMGYLKIKKPTLSHKECL